MSNSPREWLENLLSFLSVIIELCLGSLLFYTITNVAHYLRLRDNLGLVLSKISEQVSGRLFAGHKRQIGAGQSDAPHSTASLSTV